MTLLETIKAAHGERYKEFEVPEWGCTVRAKRLSIPAYIELQKIAQQVKGDEAAGTEYFVRLLQHSLVDENGERLIPDEEVGLLTENVPLVTRLGMEVFNFQGLGKNQLEDEEKNSESSPS